MSDNKSNQSSPSTRGGEVEGRVINFTSNGSQTDDNSSAVEEAEENISSQEGISVSKLGPSNVYAQDGEGASAPYGGKASSASPVVHKVQHNSRDNEETEENISSLEDISVSKSGPTSVDTQDGEGASAPYGGKASSASPVVHKVQHNSRDNEETEENISSLEDISVSKSGPTSVDTQDGEGASAPYGGKVLSTSPVVHNVQHKSKDNEHLFSKADSPQPNYWQQRKEKRGEEEEEQSDLSEAEQVRAEQISRETGYTVQEARQSIRNEKEGLSAADVLAQDFGTKKEEFQVVKSKSAQKKEKKKRLSEQKDKRHSKSRSEKKSERKKKSKKNKKEYQLLAHLPKTPSLHSTKRVSAKARRDTILPGPLYVPAYSKQQKLPEWKPDYSNSESSSKSGTSSESSEDEEVCARESTRERVLKEKRQKKKTARRRRSRLSTKAELKQQLEELKIAMELQKLDFEAELKTKKKKTRVLKRSVTSAHSYRSKARERKRKTATKRLENNKARSRTSRRSRVEEVSESSDQSESGTAEDSSASSSDNESSSDDTTGRTSTDSEGWEKYADKAHSLWQCRLPIKDSLKKRREDTLAARAREAQSIRGQVAMVRPSGTRVKDSWQPGSNVSEVLLDSGAGPSIVNSKDKCIPGTYVSKRYTLGTASADHDNDLKVIGEGEIYYPIKCMDGSTILLRMRTAVVPDLSVPMLIGYDYLGTALEKEGLMMVHIFPRPYIWLVNIDDTQTHENVLEEQDFAQHLLDKCVDQIKSKTQEISPIKYRSSSEGMFLPLNQMEVDTPCARVLNLTEYTETVEVEEEEAPETDPTKGAEVVFSTSNHVEAGVCPDLLYDLGHLSNVPIRMARVDGEEISTENRLPEQEVDTGDDSEEYEIPYRDVLLEAKIGGEPGIKDTGLYIWQKDEKMYCWCPTHVDDSEVYAYVQGALQWFNDNLGKRFKLRLKGPLCRYRGENYQSAHRSIHTYPVPKIRRTVVNSPNKRIKQGTCDVQCCAMLSVTSGLQDLEGIEGMLESMDLRVREPMYVWTYNEGLVGAVNGVSGGGWDEAATYPNWLADEVLELEGLCA